MTPSSAIDGCWPQLMFGGPSPASFRRAARYGAGWIAGGGGPQAVAQGAAAARAAWTAAGRTEKPRIAGPAYYALGANAQEYAANYLGQYDAFAGPYRDMVIQSALTTEDAVHDAIAAFADAGCDEVVLGPCDPDLGQVDALADVALTPDRAR